MIAAGAVPLWMDSRSTPLPEHEPRPDGMTSTRPVANCPASGCRRSMMTPVSGSNPPQKLSGTSAASASPRAEPLATDSAGHTSRLPMVPRF